MTDEFRTAWMSMARATTNRHPWGSSAMILVGCVAMLSGCVFSPMVEKKWRPPFSASTMAARLADPTPDALTLEIQVFDQDFFLGRDLIAIDPAGLPCDEVTLLADSKSGLIAFTADETVALEVFETEGPGLPPFLVPECSLLVAARRDRAEDPVVTVIQVWSSAGLHEVIPVEGLAGPTGSNLWPVLYPLAVVADLTIGAAILAGYFMLNFPEIWMDAGG